MSLYKFDMNADNMWDGIFKPLVFYFVLLIVVAYFLAQRFCLESYSQYSPQYGVFTDCRIMFNGKLTPVDMIKNINLQ